MINLQSVKLTQHNKQFMIRLSHQTAKSLLRLKASTPGSFIPCINYNVAPPPVET